MKLTASLVLYHGSPDEYGRAMRCFLEGSDGILHVIDNSATPLRHELFAHPRVRYQFMGRNLGFGAAHNVAIRQLAGQSDVHLLLNPDVEFAPDVLPTLLKRMAQLPDVGALMPKVLYPDGELQRLCKLLPSPVDLIFRRFNPVRRWREQFDHVYELRDLKQYELADIPSLSGCFLLLRTDLLVRVGGFDERFFMYMEDVDLVRRIGDHARTVYEPAVSITHAYGKGSYRNRKLLGYHLKSAIRYFNKWGWVVDSVRSARNRRTLEKVRAATLRPD